MNKFTFLRKAVRVHHIVTRVAYVIGGALVIVLTGYTCAALSNDLRLPWIAVPLFVTMGCTGLYMMLKGLLD